MPNRALTWTLIGLGVVIGGILYCRHYLEASPGLTLYIEAARCMMQGRPLQDCDATFTYPPLFALAMIPLVPLPWIVQLVAWYLVTLASLAACVRLSACMAETLVPEAWSSRERVWLYGLGLFLSIKFILAAIGNQSYDAIVVVLVLAGLASLAAGGPVRGGASLALAAALKATPLIFLPYLVFKRHYRAAAMMTAVLVLASLLPDLVFTVGRKPMADSYFLAWLHQVAAPALTEKLDGNPHTFWFASNPNNNSLRGLVGLFADDNRPDFRLILYPVYAAYAAIVGLIVWQTRNGRAALAIDGALLLISMLMLSPMTSQSHYVALIPAIFAVVALWRKGDPAMRITAGVFLAANLILTNATSKDLVGQTVTLWAKDRRLLVIDALLFLVFFAILVFRRQRGDSVDAPSRTRERAA